MRDPDLRRLLDKQAIHEVVLRYCRGIDRCDRELVRDCYWPDATDEHGSFVGSRDEYVAWVFDRMLPRYAMTMHFIGNVLIDLDGDRAKCEAYGMAMHRTGSDKPELDTAAVWLSDEEKLAAAHNEIVALKDQHLRAVAEQENIRKRNVQEMIRSRLRGA